MIKLSVVLIFYSFSEFLLVILLTLRSFFYIDSRVSLIIFNLSKFVINFKRRKSEEF